MSKILRGTTILVAVTFVLAGCGPPPTEVLPHKTASPTPAAPSPSPANLTEAEAMPVTLPVLDALFADQAFVSDLKTKLQLTDEEIARLRKAAGEEVLQLRRQNAEQHSGTTAEAQALAA